MSTIRKHQLPREVTMNAMLPSDISKTGAQFKMFAYFLDGPRTTKILLKKRNHIDYFTVGISVFDFTQIW